MAQPTAGKNAWAPPSPGNPIYDQIATRLSRFSPPVELSEHVAGQIQFEHSVGAGMTFPVVDAKRFRQALEAANDAAGERAFAAPDSTDLGHFPLKWSMGATQGKGYREIRGVITPHQKRFQTQDALLDRQQALYGFDAGHSAQFGDTVGWEYSALHMGVDTTRVSVHIDKTAFVLRLGDGDIALTPDMGQHTLDELLLKDMLRKALKSALPDNRIGRAVLEQGFDRLSLVYFSSANQFQRAGPRIGQVPLLRRVGELPKVGPIVNRIPLPGLSVDLMRTKQTTLQVMATCGHDGNCSATLNLSGVFGGR